jgi:hypothetical protein
MEVCGSIFLELIYNFIKFMKKRFFSFFLLLVMIFPGCALYQAQDNSTQEPTPYSDALITAPDLSKPLSSPVKIKGEVSGTFFFEAVFPITLQDANGNVLGHTVAHAEGDAMQEGLVPFSAELTFDQPATATGMLILENDNPSGLPENSKKRTFKVVFQ